MTPRLVAFTLLLSLSLLVACGDDSGRSRDAGDTSGRTDTNQWDTNPTDVPNSGETCGNGLDDDNDGRADEGCGCSPGDIQDCYIGPVSEAGRGLCVYGVQECEANFEFATFLECVGYGAPESEICDGVDNNCDGVVDEGCVCRVGDLRECYTGPPELVGTGYCASGWERCIDRGTGPEWTGCEGSVLPEAEDCNDGDEDCDGLVDEGCACTEGQTQSCYGGAEGTENVGVCRSGRQDCVAGGMWTECMDDVTGSAEVCTGGMDEDCDGLVDCADPDCNCCDTFNTMVQVVPPEAEILFLVDRSGSMQWPASGTSNSRWMELESAMRSTLPNFVGTDLGLLTFPTADGSDERRYCGVASTPHVPLGSGNASAINSYLNSNPPRAGDTPTPTAVMNAGSYFAGRSSSRTPFMILATDGLPEPNCSATVPATESALSALRGAGVDTFVIGIVGPDRSGDISGIPALRDALNRFAVAGGRPRGGRTQYYEAVDGAALARSLRSILGAATNCQLTFPNTPPAGAQIFQDANPVPASGYSLSGSTVTFTGTYCDRIQRGLVTTVRASVACP